MNRYPRLTVASAFALTFIAGAVAMHTTEAFARRRPAADPWTITTEKLRLTDSQRASIDDVFARYQPSSDAAVRSLIPRLTAISDSMQRDIDVVLTPAQRAELRGMRRPPMFMLKRKTGGTTTVDTMRIAPTR